jgi:Prasinovirus endonuclease VII
MRTHEELREYRKQWVKNRLQDPAYRLKRNEYHKEYERRKRMDPNVRERQSQQKKMLRLKFPEKVRAQDRAAHQRNRQARLRRSKDWAVRNRSKLKSYYRDYLQKHRARIRVRLRNHSAHRMATDPNYKLRKLLSKRMRDALHGIGRADSVLGLVGCSIAKFRQHIESKFKPGMSWQNWNYRGWHIDHIRPCSSFDLTDEQQQRQCFHYTNTRPLWAVENMDKGSKIICVHA